MLWLRNTKTVITDYCRSETKFLREKKIVFGMSKKPEIELQNHLHYKQKTVKVRPENEKRIQKSVNGKAKVKGDE